MKIVISSGHGKYVRGASGYIDEVDQARLVVDRVAELWRENDVGVDTFHDNTSTSQNQNLSTIVNYHNSRSRDLDVSVHFNAYQTTSKPMGVEVLYVTQSTLASNLSSALASTLGLPNRGGKYRSDLYFLNNTNKPAILIETCFVDSSADTNSYLAKFEDVCRTIAEVVGRITIGEQPPPDIEQPPEPTEVPRIDITIKAKGQCIISINGQDFPMNMPGPEEPSTAVFPDNQQNIVCTVFGGGDDPNNSAYEPYDPITDTELSCALPGRFEKPYPKVAVHNVETGRDVICNIRDIGPWNIDDYYWETGQRPQAESGIDKKGRPTNGAGLDLTPAAAEAIGLEGKGTVNWRFLT